MHERGAQRSTGPDEPASKDKLRLWLRLLRASRFIEGALRERLRSEFGATLPRFDAMAALYRAERSMTMTELSRSLMVSNGNVTGIVERLATDGLVLRAQKSSDRRTVVVRLSAAGRRAFERMAGAHEAWVDELIGALHRDEIATLSATLSRLNQHRGCGERE